MSQLSKFLRSNGWRSSTKSIPELPSDARRIELPGIPPFEFHTHKDRPDPFISAGIEQHGAYESLETEVFRRLLPEFPTFLDIGGNIGWYSTIALQTMASGSRIFAFEPEPGNFALLQKNATARNGVSISHEQAAVSNRPGHLTLHLSDSNPGDHRLYSSEPNRKQVDVPVIALDKYFAAKPLGPTLIKCDTQGSEPKILPGARQALGAAFDASVFVFEFWPHGMAAAGEDVGAFIKLLSEWPHRPYILDGHTFKLRPIDWSDIANRCQDDLAPETEAFVDILLVGPQFLEAQTLLSDLFENAALPKSAKPASAVPL